MKGDYRRILYWAMTCAVVLLVGTTTLDLLNLGIYTRGAWKDGATVGPTTTLEQRPIEGYASVEMVVADVEEKLPPGVMSSGMLAVSAPLDPADRMSQFLQRLKTVPADVLLLAIVWLLRGLAKPAEGDPFVRANVWRLRGIAGCVVLLGMHQVWIVPLADVQLTIRSAFREVPAFASETSYAAFGIAFLVFILGEVFAHGVHLREEVDGLV
jgi:hypothetical protein